MFDIAVKKIKNHFILLKFSFFQIFGCYILPTFNHGHFRFIEYRNFNIIFWKTLFESTNSQKSERLHKKVLFESFDSEKFEGL